MRNETTRRWLGAALIAAMTMLSIPALAAERTVGESEHGLQSAWSVALEWVWHFFDHTVQADETDHSAFIDPNGSTLAAGPTETPAAQDSRNAER